jgi:hypothetical protein
MHKERSSSTIFSDIKCKTAKQKYPNLVTSKPTLFSRIFDLSLKVGAYNEKRLSKLSFLSKYLINFQG